MIESQKVCHYVRGAFGFDISGSMHTLSLRGSIDRRADLHHDRDTKDILPGMTVTVRLWMHHMFLFMVSSPMVLLS